MMFEWCREVLGYLGWHLVVGRPLEGGRVGGKSSKTTGRASLVASGEGERIGLIFCDFF